MIIWLIFFLFLQTKPSFCRLLAAPSWTFLPKYRLSEYTRCGGGRGGMGPQLNLNDIGRNCLLGNRKKIAKFLMRTFTCRSTFLFGRTCIECWAYQSICMSYSKKPCQYCKHTTQCLSVRYAPQTTSSVLCLGNDLGIALPCG